MDSRARRRDSSAARTVWLGVEAPLGASPERVRVERARRQAEMLAW